MKTFFQDLFDYNNHVNNELIIVFNDKQEEISDRCIQLFSHILNAHKIWNSRIKGENPLVDRWEIQLVQNYYTMNKQNYEDSIDILNKLPIDRHIQYAMSTGQMYKNTIQEIFFHVMNHSTYHRAQIATEFKQIGLDPLITDYIFYKRK